MANITEILTIEKERPADVHRGVEFLGFYVKPWRRYPTRDSLLRMTEKFRATLC